ncbi:MAG TPA: phosphoribosyltransferase [Microbacteriaceae bacterium]|nr:phosphoribosyltransferase [Microbacteriaceae bacterium]
MSFHDRTDAGKQLAQLLDWLRGADAVVLGLPRGGVPVAYEVAHALDLPLDVVIVRKLGVPWHEELAMGAIGDGARVVDDETVASLGVTADQLDAVERREQIELAERARRFRLDRGPLEIRGKIAIVVDDGVATGATARAACQVVRAAGAARIILAVPVAPPDWQPQPGVDADELVCIERPSPFFAVGQWYENFTQTTDEQVVELLQRAT